MDPSTLTRDDARVLAGITERGDALITTSGCKIYVPDAYYGRELGSQGEEVRVLAVFGIVVGNYYAVSSALALMELTPSKSGTEVIGTLRYHVFEFMPGDVITPNVNLLQTKTLPFWVYDVFVDKAIIPWFMDYEDLPQLFYSMGHHASVGMGVDMSILEMIISAIARNPKDLTVYYRQVPKASKPRYVPLRSAAHNTTNTATKLLGNYSGETITSALTTTSTESESVESKLLQ